MLIPTLEVANGTCETAITRPFELFGLRDRAFQPKMALPKNSRPRNVQNNINKRDFEAREIGLKFCETFIFSGTIDHPLLCFFFSD